MDRDPLDLVTEFVPGGGSVRRARIEPVAAALEGVGGKRDAGDAGTEETGPVDLRPRGVQVCEGADDVGLLVRRLGPALGRDTSGDERGERGLGPDLDDVRRGQRRDTAGEPHGATDVVDPVPDFGRVVLARHPDELPDRLGSLHLFHDGAERGEYVVHVGGVERVTDLQ